MGKAPKSDVKLEGETGAGYYVDPTMWSKTFEGPKSNPPDPIEPILISDSDEDADTTNGKFREESKTKCSAQGGRGDSGDSGYISDGQDDLPLSQFIKRTRKQRSERSEDEEDMQIDILEVEKDVDHCREDVGAGNVQEEEGNSDDPYDQGSELELVYEEENCEGLGYSKRRKYRAVLKEEKLVHPVDTQKRIFSYQNQKYCYSSTVFGQILDLPNVGRHLREMMSRFGKKHIQKHFGDDSVERMSYPIEHFHNFGNPQQEESVKKLLRKWAGKLHPKRCESKCGKGAVIAAMHAVRGKSVNYPQYLSDFMHSRIINLNSSRVWFMCTVIMDFHTSKNHNPSDGGCTVENNLVDGPLPTKSLQQPELENDVKNGAALKENELHESLKPSDHKPDASTCTATFSCKVEEPLESFVAKKEDVFSSNGSRDNIEEALMKTLQQIETVLSHGRKVTKERGMEKQELEKTIREREEECALLQRNLQRFLDGTVEIQQKLKSATDFIEKSEEDLGRLQKKHDDLANNALIRKRQEIEKGDLAKRHKKEEDEMLQNIGATARDLKGIMKNSSLFDPATSH